MSVFSISPLSEEELQSFRKESVDPEISPEKATAWLWAVASAIEVSINTSSPNLKINVDILRELKNFSLSPLEQGHFDAAMRAVWAVYCPEKAGKDGYSLEELDIKKRQRSWQNHVMAAASALMSRIR